MNRSASRVLAHALASLTLGLMPFSSAATECRQPLRVSDLRFVASA